MRAFMAVEIDFRLINKILKVQEAIKMADAQVKFVDGENLHFTVKFFGDITPDQAQQITSLTDSRLEDQKSFQMYIKGTGVFPNLDRPRVLWLGVDDPQEFSQLQERLDDDWVRMGHQFAIAAPVETVTIPLGVLPPGWHEVSLDAGRKAAPLVLTAHRVSP